MAAAGPRGGKTGLGALADQVTLELGQRGEDVEHRLAASGGGVNRLLQAAEPGTPVGERGDSVHQVTQRAAEPVKLSDHQGVAGAELVMDAIQLGAGGAQAVLVGGGDGSCGHAWRWCSGTATRPAKLSAVGNSNSSTTSVGRRARAERPEIRSAALPRTTPCGMSA
jgi:hypothetical protein